MLKKIMGFLFGLVISLWKSVWGVVDPELNEEFFEKIDHDYFPGQ